MATSDESKPKKKRSAPPKPPAKRAVSQSESFGPTTNSAAKKTHPGGASHNLPADLDTLPLIDVQIETPPHELEAFAKSTDPPSARPGEPLPSLWESPTFLAFWLSRFLSQTGQGALMYGLLVLLVDQTDSSMLNSIFVICAIVPAIFFGLPAGVAVDALPRRALMVTLNMGRTIFVLALALQLPSIAGIFATALAVWIIHQFYAPAESSLLATIVPRHRLTEAQALSNLALVVAQGIGLIVLAPLLLKVGDPRYLFAICSALFLTAGLLTAQLPSIAGTVSASQRRTPVGETLLKGARILFHDSILFRVTTVDMMVGIGLSGLVVIAPLYLRRILNTSSDNTVFVFAPAALGVILGLKTAPWLGKHIDLRVLATSSMIIFAICIAAYGFMSDIYWIANDTLGIPVESAATTLRIAPIALLVMFFSIPAGYTSSVVGVAARSVTLTRAPERSRGQVIATQSLAQNLGALLPTLMAGAAADVIGVERVAIAIAIVMMIGATVVFLTRRQPRTTLAAAT